MFGNSARRGRPVEARPPVPNSNFVSEENSGSPQQTQVNMPSRFSKLSVLIPGALRPMLARDLVLLRRELFAPFGIALVNALFHGC